MNRSLIVDVLFWCFAAGSVVTAYLVFRTDSMVRAAFWLLASFVGVGAILVMLAAEFLGMVLILMMAGEMLIMAVVMVMYMMNPAGLNPMFMVHQLGFELLGDSMLVFQTAGVALLATMIGAIALASRNGRFGTADEGSQEPALDIEELESP